jgi:alpha-galactosidase
MLIDIGDTQLALQAESAEPIVCKEAPLLTQAYELTGSPVALLHPYDDAPFFRHGWHSWSLSAWLQTSCGLLPPKPEVRWPMIDHPSLLAWYPFSSSAVGALQAPDGNILLLGALELDGFVTADEQTLRGAYWQSRHRRPRAWFLAYGSEEEVFAAYAGLLGKRFGRRGIGAPPKVWCSWYSLYTAIDEALLKEILAGLAGLPFDVFQVDDGWQVCVGDWHANAKFPTGMEALAQSVRASGYTPGIWLAPLAVAPQSSLFQQHPDWLVRASDGRPQVAGHNWGDVYYGLDVTHPGAQEWLAGLISTIRQWGYEYLKLDFLYAAALPGYRHEAVTGEEAYRKGMEIMRQAAGDAYILACGSPIIASLGLVDGMRIGSDVAPFWDNHERSAHLHDLSGPSTLNALRTCLHRLWLRPLVHVDPDVAFFRTRYNLLLPRQKQVLQDLVQVTGFRATSDLPAWLDDGERAALQVFLETQPEISRLDRYRYQIGDRTTDFSTFAGAWPA